MKYWCIRPTDIVGLPTFFVIVGLAQMTAPLRRPFKLLLKVGKISRQKTLRVSVLRKCYVFVFYIDELPAGALNDAELVCKFAAR